MHDIFLTYINHIIIFISIGNQISYTFPNLFDMYLLYVTVILFGNVAIGIFKYWKYCGDPDFQYIRKISNIT